MTTEIKIGTNLKNDFFKILIDIIVTTTTNAIIKLSLSKVLLLYPAMLNATGLSLSPITIIIGPTTTGGKNDFILSTPNFKTMKDIITYTSPADIIPPFNIAIPCSLKTRAVAPINAKDDPKNTGTIPL